MSDSAAMSLQDYKEPSREIPFSGGSFTVYPLTANELGKLYSSHSDTIFQAARLWGPAILCSEGRAAQKAMASLVAHCTPLVGDIIGLATREEPTVLKPDRDGSTNFADYHFRDIVAGQLPAGVQLMALAAIIELSVGPGGFGERMQAIARSVNLPQTNHSKH